MVVGIIFGILACMIWGAVYIAPLLVPTYDPAVLATGRYVIFGMLSVGLALSQFKEFRHYKIADWYQALLLDRKSVV